MPDDAPVLKSFNRAPVSTETTFFKMRVPLLDEGRMDTEVARTQKMSARMKVYASGGENELHTHAHEDHCFFVMQGSVRFYDKDNQTQDVGKHEGVMIPAGSYYWFEATSTEPLVMIRVGARLDDKQGDDRLNIKGQPMAGGSPENKAVPRVVRPGAFFE